MINTDVITVVVAFMWPLIVNCGLLEAGEAGICGLFHGFLFFFLSFLISKNRVGIGTLKLIYVRTNLNEKYN